MKTDPIKDLNTQKYFNPVSLKSRYYLINLNKQNEKFGYKFGSHWKKNIPYPILDSDILSNKFSCQDSSIKEINIENKNLCKLIYNKGIITLLDSFDQTLTLSDELRKIKKKPKRDFYYTKLQKFERKLKKEQDEIVNNLNKDKSRNKPIKIFHNKANSDLNGYIIKNNNNKLNSDIGYITTETFHENKTINKSHFDKFLKINNSNFYSPRKINLSFKKPSKSEKIVINVKKLDNNIINDKFENSLSYRNLIGSREKKEFIINKTKCLEPNQMPKLSFFQNNHLPRFNLTEIYDKQNKNKNKELKKLYDRKNKKIPNLINLEFNNLNVENNLTSNFN